MNADDRTLGRLEEHLGRLLVTGISISAVLLLAGLVLFLRQPASAVAGTLLMVGLFVLMGTPMLRVLVSFAEYVRMRDWFFVTTTVLVLAVLGTSVFLALKGR